jgi:hypothetical protein
VTLQPEARAPEESAGGDVPIPTIRSRTVPSDLASGWEGVILWGAPIFVILAGSILLGLGRVSLPEAGVLWVLGTAWLGATCLLNARRCGRTHCWIVGIALPVVAVGGLLNLFGVLGLAWTTYLSLVWLSIIAAFVIEWLRGPYLVGRPRSPPANRG